MTGDAPSAMDTVAWLPAEGRIRTEGGPAGQRVAHLIDTRSGEVTAVMDAARAYEDLGPMAAVMLGSLLSVPESAAVRAEGTDKVAGLDCTVWRIDPGKGATDEAVKRLCMTSDGVPLRLVEGEGAEAEILYVATRVDLGPQDPRRFHRPEGYAPVK